MTYQPPQPPVMPGYPAQPPQGDWTPPAPKKRGPLPWLIGALVIAFLGVGALGIVLVGQSRHKTLSPATSASPVAVLTQAGAQRACRTAFSKEFEDRQEANVKKDGNVIVSVQGIDLAETWQDGAGYAVNGTVRYTLTAWPVDPVQGTLELTCKVTGVDERPVTFVDNRN